MKRIENDKGFKVLALTHEEGEKLGWGILENNKISFVCAKCNDLIEGDLYYIAVLNDVMSKECYEKWYESAINYAEDRIIENRNYNYIIDNLS